MREQIVMPLQHFDKTCYYFSAVDNLEENVTLLQQFISETSFTEASITREKRYY